MRIAELRTSLITATCLPLIAATLQAGVVYTLEEKDPEGEIQHNVEVVAQDGKVKIRETSEQPAPGGGGDSVMIFDGSASEMMVIEPERRSYTVIDEKALNEISEAMKRMQEQMEAALAQVPPAQREQMKQMMGKRMPGMAAKEAPKVEVRATGEEKEVEGYDTRAYDVVIDDSKKMTLWVTDWDDLEGSRDVKNSMQTMGDFFSRMLESLPAMEQSQPGYWVNAINEIDGFPVQSEQYGSDGKVEGTTTLTKIETRDISGSEFQAPEGYQRQRFDMGM